MLPPMEEKKPLGTKRSDFQISGNPEFRKIRISGTPDFRNSELPVSGNPDFRKSGVAFFFRRGSHFSFNTFIRHTVSGTLDDTAHGHYTHMRQLASYRNVFLEIDFGIKSWTP